MGVKISECKKLLDLGKHRGAGMEVSFRVPGNQQSRVRDEDSLV